jgi:hypothetical protein
MENSVYIVGQNVRVFKCRRTKGRNFCTSDNTFHGMGPRSKCEVNPIMPSGTLYVPSALMHWNFTFWPQSCP